MYNINHRIGMNKGIVILLGKLCQQSITVAFVGIGSVIHRGTVHFPNLGRVSEGVRTQPSQKYPNIKPPKLWVFCKSNFKLSKYPQKLKYAINKYILKKLKNYIFQFFEISKPKFEHALVFT